MPEKTITLLTTQIQRQAQQLVRAFHEFRVFNQPRAGQLGEIVKGDGLLNRIVSQRAVTSAAAVSPLLSRLHGASTCFISMRL